MKDVMLTTAPTRQRFVLVRLGSPRATSAWRQWLD